MLHIVTAQALTILGLVTFLLLCYCIDPSAAAVSCQWVDKLPAASYFVAMPVFFVKLPPAVSSLALGGDPAQLPPKGTQQPPLFGPNLLWTTRQALVTAVWSGFSTSVQIQSVCEWI